MDEHPDFDPNFEPISIPDPGDIPALYAAANENPELFPYYRVAANWLVELSETSNPAPNLNDLEFQLTKRFFLEATFHLTRASGAPRLESIAVDVSSTLIRHVRFIVCIRGWATRFVQRLKEVQEARDTRNDTNGQAKSTLMSNQETQGYCASSETTSVVAMTRQQHSAEPRLPTLPPEIIYSILSIVAAQPEHYPPALATYALVNKTWSVAARQLLWKKVRLSDIRLLQPFYYSFAARRCSSLPKSLSSIAGLDVPMQLQELEIGCRDVSGVWELVLQRLFLFPNLRTLQLNHLVAFSKFQVLFTQPLPSLQKLGIIGLSNHSARDWNWICKPPYDREQARAFFSRLAHVEFLICDMIQPHSEFLDVAHHNLRSIMFPSQAPDTIITQFLAGCSGALTVVGISGTALSQETWEVFAERCTGLRALFLQECGHVDVEGFVAFMERRGPELRSLHLCGSLAFDDYTDDIDSRMIQSISTHCRSLEEFSLAFFANSLDEECAEFLSKRGKTLKKLNLLEVDLVYRPATIVERVATNCPNLEVLDLPVSFDLQKPTQEGVVVGLGTLATLFQKCKRLRSLGMVDEFGDTSSTSASEHHVEVEAKLRRIARPATMTVPRRFYNWTRYSSR
ncbi:hypothetical protein HK102_000635 [Quaeritorhiza haematococci]|nr:hypothetical protein HK102_000635 [Quaeritorhiza haematococci]